MCPCTIQSFFLSMSPYRNRRRWTNNMLISQAGRFSLFLSPSILWKNFDMWYVMQTCHIINKKKQPFKIDKLFILSAGKWEGEKDDCYRWSFVRFAFFFCSSLTTSMIYLLQPHLIDFSGKINTYFYMLAVCLESSLVDVLL